MKTLKLCLPIILSVALLGCNNEAVATNTQTISVQKVTPANVAKPKTTTLKQNDDSEVQLVESVTEPVEEVTESVTTKKSAKPVNSNSAVKDVIIDGTGSLVLSKADGTFVSFAPVQGPVGPQGPAGPAGPQGESIKGDKGDQGEPGKDGRGIDHLELDADKNLIAYYTDGTTQNVGNLTVTAPSENVTPPVDDTPEYEKIGYELKCFHSLPITYSEFGAPNDTYVSDYSIDNVSFTLIEINNENPSKKYKYLCTIDYSNVRSTADFGILAEFVFDIDNTNSIRFSIDSIQGSSTKTIYSPLPYVNITNFSEFLL